jgi:hypothetical protein
MAVFVTTYVAMVDAIIERSRARYEKEGGISTREMRKQLGLPVKKPEKKRERKRPSP